MWDWEDHCTLALCLQHTDMLLNRELQVPPQPQGFIGSSTGSSVFPILTVGVSEPWIWVHFTALVGCKHVKIHYRPFLYGIYCCRCFCMVFRDHKECCEDVPGNTRGQIINPQSTSYSQYTNTWNSSRWVEFVSVIWDSVNPKIYQYVSRQSSSEANPLKVSDDTILPGCLISLL